MIFWLVCCRLHTLCFPGYYGQAAIPPNTSQLYPSQHTGRPIQSPTFHCAKCNKKFTTKHNLIGHDRAVHQKLKFICDSCGRKYSYWSDLHKHYKYTLCERKTWSWPLAGEVIIMVCSEWYNIIFLIACVEWLDSLLSSTERLGETACMKYGFQSVAVLSWQFFSIC